MPPIHPHLSLSLSLEVPFCLYSFSFAPTTGADVYAPRDHIEQYLKTVAKKYDLEKHMRFNERVNMAVWDDARSSYLVETSRGKYWAMFLVSGTGLLSVPKMPAFVQDAKISTKVKVVHSAEYDRSLRLDGKTVAVIGNGSSGVQLVEAIQPIAKRLVLVQRTPKWVFPKPFLTIPTFLLWPMLNLPFSLGVRFIRLIIFVTFELLHLAVRSPSPTQRLFTKFLKALTLSANPNAELPAYRVGCSRLIVHAGYPETLTKSNVRVVNDAVEGLTGSSIKTRGGKTIKVDVAIFATGFKVSDCGPGFPVHNAAGESLTEVWAAAVEKCGGSSLYGITTPSFPNLFILYGPHTNTIFGSITYFSECGSSYVAQIINAVVKRGKRKAVVREECVIEFAAYIRKKFLGRPELGECNAWYKGTNPQAPVTNFPGGMLEYWWLTRRWNEEHYEIN